MSLFSDAFVLTSPTGSGKTAIAVALAPRLNAEIVAMDSMTVYRGMDVGTAKPTAEEREVVPHHLIDVLDPWESANVAWWLGRAEAACVEIRSRGKRPLFVGGTPFYLKALLHGLFPAPPVDPALRRELEAEAERIGSEAFHAKLAAVDAKSAARLHPNDTRRVVRALEVHALTGRPISSFQQSWDSPGFGNASPPAPIPCVALELARDELYARIDRRVLGMLAAGWLEECRTLLALPRPLSPEASQALGYRELFEFLALRADYESTVGVIQTRTRQFAKRQLTWFRGLGGTPAPAGDLEAVRRALLSPPASPK